MIETGLGVVSVETGRIINVDMKHWTVDVQTSFTQKKLLDMQIMAPYLHFNSGEGIFAMPEVGAKVKVCTPSESPPFILGFCTTFEREAPAADDGAPGVSTQPATELSDEDGVAGEVTFRSGRPNLQQGDLMLRCRDGNQVWLHRGGAIEITSTGLCRRFYIPINNMIRDVCENWNIDSLAGNLSWSVDRVGTSGGPLREDPASFTLSAKNLAQDEKATVHVRIGHVDETNRIRIAIAPESLDEDGEATGEMSFLLEIDEDGNIEGTVAGGVTLTITGELAITATGAATFDYGSDLTETIGGGQTVNITGAHEMTAMSSKENVSASKEIDCPSIKLGGAGAVTPVVLMTPALIAFLAGHTHSTVLAPSGPPIPPLAPAAAQAIKVFGE
jgi:hypothetical protein